mgnify:FL=1
MTKAAAALPKRLVAAEAVTLQEAKARAILLSSGTLSTAELRKRGHPYARRNPTSPNPQIINAQTGVFRQAYTTPPPVPSASGVTASVVNVARYSGYMRGTRLMVARPLPQAVQLAVRVRRLARTAGAIRSAFLNP